MSLWAFVWSLPGWAVLLGLLGCARRCARQDRLRRARFQVRVTAWVDQQRAWLQEQAAAGMDPTVIAQGHVLLDALEAPLRG